MFTLYKYCGVRSQFQKINSILPKHLLVNKAPNAVQPALAHQVNDISTISFEPLDLKVIQIVLTAMTLTFTCYLLIKLWTYDYLNTKFLDNWTYILEDTDHGQDKHIPTSV